jgi:nucleotidyltransferase substrate binding protein (TIGR01987 family)
MKQIKLQLSKFEKSLTKLKESLSRSLEDDDIVLDAVIQRFEFTFENSWKTIKLLLKYKGENNINTPRDCIKTAYRYGWIKEERPMLELLESRNLTSHTYDHKEALNVYNTVKANFKLFEHLLTALKKEL